MTKGKHYALVHGACHGAWCWYKLKSKLQSGGHRVTVVDLAASGINTNKREDVHTFSEYSEPLMAFLDSLPQNGKVILVGHSFGGLSLALAMDKFPHKIAVGVFLAAFAPETQNRPSYVVEQQPTKREEINESLNTEVSPCENGTTEPLIFGPNCLSAKLYQLCPIEFILRDLELAKTLVRPGSLFLQDLSKAKNFSEKGYGSVPRVYIVCKEDLIIRSSYRKWMIQNAGIDNVLELEDADHMAMLSKPGELYQSLLRIAQKYT